MDIKGAIQQLEKAKLDLFSQAVKISKKEKEVILDYIREKQLFERGIDGDGNSLKAYKPFTIAVKRIKNQPTDRTTLFDTGSFYDKFDLKLTDQFAIGVFSRDSKTPDLVQKYGFSIFKFTEENRKEIDTNIFEKQLIKWLDGVITNIITKI